MVKNQVVKYKCGVPDVTLTISIFRGRKEFSIAVKTKEADGKIKTGCRNWYEHAEEDQAVAEFEKLNKDAVKEGWVLMATSKKSQEFDKIPAPPGLKTATGNGHTTPKPKK